jgi:hypothetical protein
MIDHDIIQRLKVAGIFLLQFYKVITGTLTGIFIPQSCGDHVCSLQENLNNSKNDHKLIVYWNVFTMFMFYVYYFVELRREEWSIKYLDIDNDKPDNCLREIIVHNPKLNKKMDQLNRNYYITFRLNCMVYFMNLLMTVKLIQDNYYNNSTISCFVSFSLLIIHKLFNSYCVVSESVKNDKMMSAYMSEFVSFNVLDSDYLEEKEKEKQKKRSIIPPNNP